jgi:3-oxoacyl-[acyl-carrier protein] reductase
LQRSSNCFSFSSAGGRIITVGSVHAMTKAAVTGLPRGLARDLGPRGITINNVQPGQSTLT